MSDERITKRSVADPTDGQTDWKALDALTDEDIEAAVREDPDAAPMLSADWFSKAQVVEPAGKAMVTLRVDRDVLDFFKSSGRGYQTRMNAVLRAFMEHGQEQEKRRA
ncbi:hypothetical protein GAY33_05360 [Azospirillum brasilense]|uniref:BrnA antitoxin family protein n=1 Tax=Azospirillum argentinense TaxID=2970906 RepID=UPI001909C62A|nr:BrnA antitoxin family protein [Azospirillum argentinense]MBK3798664.1 hypothetical protein [Azospirillum argentinense]